MIHSFLIRLVLNQCQKKPLRCRFVSSSPVVNFHSNPVKSFDVKGKCNHENKYVCDVFLKSNANAKQVKGKVRR